MLGSLSKTPVDTKDHGNVKKQWFDWLNEEM